MEQYDLKTQARIAKIREVKNAIEHRFFEIPGVNLVSIGLKIKDGKRTNEFAICIDVSKKKPLSELPSEHVLPPRIGGVKTDVNEGGALKLTIGELGFDTHPYRPLKGGALIKPVSSEPGTLGCFAQTDGPNPQIVLLTNQHVLFPGISTRQKGTLVGQPEVCSNCSGCVDATIARADHDAVLSSYPEGASPEVRSLTPTGVDAAIATLQTGMQWRAEVISTGEGDTITTESIMGTDPLGPFPRLHDSSGNDILAVHKRGMKTRNTAGFVHQISVTAPRAVDDYSPKRVFLKDQILVKPAQPGTPFMDRGDSGSVLLSSDSKVVGLCWAGIVDRTDPKFGWAVASPIEAVEDQLHIKIADSVTFQGTNTVLTQPSANPLPNGAPMLRSGVPAVPAEAFKRALERVLQTHVGRLYADLIQRHAPEVRALINSNKRVATVWHRNGGPNILQSALQAIQSPDRPLPVEINGKPLVESIENIFKSLKKYGSLALSDDVTQYGSLLQQFAGQSYNQILSSLASR